MTAQSTTDPKDIMHLMVHPASKVLMLGLLLAIGSPAQAALVHRYSFSAQPGTTNVIDSVGGANGIVQGGAEYDGQGSLFLNGTDGFVQLPKNLVTNLTNITVEAWVTDNSSGNWARIYDFGNSAGGEGQQGGGTQYLFLSLPSGFGNLRGAYTITGGGAGEQIVEMTGRPAAGSQAHIVWTSDAATHTGRLYVNKVLVGINTNMTLTPASLGPTVNDWLGKSQFTPDAYFNGSFREFRIYDAALNAVQIAGSFVSGPATPGTDPGAIQAVSLQVPSSIIIGNPASCTATADFASASGVSLSGVPGVTYQSSDTNIVMVTVEGQLQALKAGSVTITASFQGKKDAKPVSARDRTGLVIAGTLYVDLRATDTANGTATWTNRSGLGDFSAVGSPTYEPNVGGTGFPGVSFGGNDAYLGPVTTSDLDGSSDRSIEVWAFNPAIAGEETLVAWAHRGTTRRNMSFNYGSNGSYGAAGLWADDIGWSGAPAAGKWHHLVFTYDGNRTGKVYADGVLKTVRTFNGVLNTWPGEPIRLGAQGNSDGVAADFDFGQSLTGYIGVVRVHGNLLTDLDVYNNYLFGMNLTSPGALQTIALQFDPSSPALSGGTNLILNGLLNLAVNATYANVASASPPASVVTFQSSNTNVVTVNASGLAKAVGLGSATLSANFQGQTASTALSVVAQPAPVLRHRWSFNDAPGSTTVKDSVGNADGTLNGGATLVNGAVVLNGVDGFVDLPNDLVTNYNSITIETWVTDSGSAGWARIFDFGNSSGGEGNRGGGIQYMFLSLPAGGGNLRGAYNAGSGEQLLQWPSGGRPPVGKKSHIVWTTDGPTRTGRLYVDGVQVGINTNLTITPASIGPMFNVWLGQSQYNDPYFNGSIDEFRIYDGALPPADILNAQSLGPDVLPGTNLGAVQSLNLIVGTNALLLGGFTTAKLTANYATLSGVDVTANTNTTFVSGSPGVITVGSGGVVDTVGVGTGLLIASFQGTSVTNSITVSQAPGVPVTPVLIHRYSFSEGAGSTVAKDTAGTADGNVMGTASFSGNGKLTLAGGAAATAGFVDLPSGLISGLTNATFEAWVLVRASGTWQRIFDFGDNSAGPGQQGTGITYLFLTPQSNAGTPRFAATINSNGAESPVLNGPSAIPLNQWVHYAVTYNYTAGNARLYINGQKVAQGAVRSALSQINDVNVWLGKSNWPDPFFTGQFDEFRIYNGAFLDADVAADYAAGPDLLPSQVVAQPPRLTVSRSANNLVLAWPVSTPTFNLESSVLLGPGAAWTTVSGGSAGVVNGQKTVTLPIAGTTLFYRLRK